MSENHISINTNFEIQSGFAFPSTAFVESGIPVVRMSDLKNGKLIFNNTKYIKEFWLKTASPFILKTGDYLMGMSGSLTNHAIVTNKDLPALLNQRVGRLKPKSSVENYQYVCYWLQSEVYARYAEIQGEGAAQKNISSKQIGQFKYRKANALEQQKIVTILQTIDQAIEQTEALIEKYQQIKAGLMHDLFTRGITADGKLRPPRKQAPELYQETPIGWIPKDWGATKLEIILLESGGYLQTGPFGSQLHAHEYTFEGVPVVMPQNINNGNIDTEEIARITESRAKTLNRHRLKLGDIIISRRGELNRAASIKEKDVGSVCGTGCFLLRLAGSDLDANFFSMIYSHDIIQRQVVGLAVGSTMPSLNNGIMKKLLFPKIDTEEQNRISCRVNLIEEKIEALRDYSLKLLKQKQGLMQDLLTGKVPVKVDNEAVYA